MSAHLTTPTSLLPALHPGSRHSPDAVRLWAATLRSGQLLDTCTARNTLAARPAINHPLRSGR